MQAVEIFMSVFRLSLCLCCTVSFYSWVSQLLKECRYIYIYNKCNTVYLMHFQSTFPQHFFTTFCVEFFFYIPRKLLSQVSSYFSLLTASLSSSCPRSTSPITCTFVTCRSSVSTSSPSSKSSVWLYCGW